MNRKLLGNTVSIGAATLLGIGLWSMPHAYAGNDSFEEVPVTTGLVVNGLNIGFDPKGNNSRSFKVGTAEVTTVLKKDGTVGIKVLKGSLTLTTPTGETLATLTQDDEIELSGFLDNAKMFELLHGSDTQMLRLGAIGTVSISNLGAKPVSFSLGKTAMVVGAKTGRQDAAIGKIFNGPLPKNIMATLKPGVTVIGLDGENKPISITKDQKGNITRKQLDDQSFADQKKRAGNLLQDARKVVPILGVPIKIVLDKTTLEITGTADGAIIKVIDGEPLKLGTANAQYVGQLPLHAEIQISGLTLKDGAFLTPVSGSVLLLPVTASYTIINLSDTPLTLGKTGEQVKLNKNEKMTGSKSGFTTNSGFNPADLKNLPAGTGVAITNSQGETIFLIVGDPLVPQKNGVENYTLINASDHVTTIEVFNLGTFVVSSGGGVQVPTALLTISIDKDQFIAQIPGDAFKNTKNAGKGNTVVIDRSVNLLILVQGGNTVSQSTEQKGGGTNTSSFAILVLGGNVSPLIGTLLNTVGGGNTNTDTTITKTNNKTTTQKKGVLVLLLTDSKGGTILPLIVLITSGDVANGSIASTTP